MVKLTQEEIEKIAVSVGTLNSVSNFITNTMPKAFQGVRAAAGSVGLKAENAFGARVIGGIAGGIGGAVTTKDQDPTTRGRSMLARTAIGATAGAFGGGWLANKGSTFGSTYEAALKPVGVKMKNLAAAPNLTDAQRGEHLTKMLAKNLSPKVRAMAPGSGITTRPLLGKTTEATGQVLNHDLPTGLHMVGDFAKGRINIKNQGWMKGTYNTLKDNVKEHFTFTKTVDKVGDPNYGKTFQYNRSTVGKVLAPLAMSGVGMGVTDAALDTNEDGSKPSIMKRIRKGATSTLTWGMAPRLMMAKATAYDIPKTLMGGHNQPQQANI